MTRVAPRKPIFVGCEGGSERSYATFLNGLADDAGLHVHLETRDLGGGDAKTGLDRAIREFNKYRDRAGSKTPGFVILDIDGAHGNQAALDQAAQNAGLSVIWQDPCHEAMLLRHFAGQEQRQPQDCDAAGDQLVRHWPSYKKNTSANGLGDILTLDHVRRAAGVTPALQALLNEIGL